MGPSQLIQDLSARFERDNSAISFIRNNQEFPALRIFDATSRCGLPNGQLQPIPAAALDNFQGYIAGCYGHLSYTLEDQEAVFPSQPFPKADGIGSADALFEASFKLCGATLNIGKVNPKVIPFLEQSSETRRFNIEQYSADCALYCGIADTADDVAFRGFGWIGGQGAQGCIIGARVSTDAMPKSAILSCELFSLIVMLHGGPIRGADIASMATADDGQTYLHVGIRHNQPLIKNQKGEWSNMLRWGLWWREPAPKPEDDDEDDEADDEEEDEEEDENVAPPEGGVNAEGNENSSEDESGSDTDEESD